MKYLHGLAGIILTMLIASSLYAQSADEILAKHFEAINQQKLSTVQTINLKAKMTMMGQELPMTIMQKRPAKMRTEVEIQGQKMMTVINGKEGWMVNPMMGSKEPQQLPQEQLEQATSGTDFFDSELFNYGEKGHSVKKLADERMMGNSMYVLELTHKNGMVFKFYIDKDNYLIQKSRTTVSNMGMDMEVESFHKDYRDVDGIQFPHTLEIHSNGQLFQTIKLSDIELNKKIEDSLFEKSSLVN